jgi:hypothetical protein
MNDGLTIFEIFITTSSDPSKVNFGDKKGAYRRKLPSFVPLFGIPVVRICQRNQWAIAVVLNLLGSKSRLKASFETKVPVKEICHLFVAIMFQCMLCSPSKY